MGDYDLCLRGMKNRKTATDLPEGYVRENFYLCYEGAQMVGVFSLKFELTDYLLHYGGHVVQSSPSAVCGAMPRRSCAMGWDSPGSSVFPKSSPCAMRTASLPKE